MIASFTSKQWHSCTIILSAAAAAAAFSAAAAAVSVCIWRRKSRGVKLRIRLLESSLGAALEKSAAERQGRIRAQQALRKALEQHGSVNSTASFPMIPIATVQSCFSTRNGTPRQPLIVPLARACLVLDASRAPPEALEGLAEYSHCWVLYIFHLNTDLEKLWKQSSRSKLKAKVRVPRLKGGKKGVLATRSPHRPCPIGLTVAKIEAVHGHFILLSGVDLVDGTPVLDVKPYLPSSDIIQGATVPQWVMEDSTLATASVKISPEFGATFASCWAMVEKYSLYASADEFQSLIKQVLSWDIRSVSQRNRPHDGLPKKEMQLDDNQLQESKDGDYVVESEGSDVSQNGSIDVIYHLVLEGIDISYKIGNSSNVIVEKATISKDMKSPVKCFNHRMFNSMDLEDPSEYG